MISSRKLEPLYRHPKLRIALWIFLALISLGTIAGIGYLFWQQRSLTDLWQQSRIAWQEKRPEEAKQLLLRLLKNDPSQVEAYRLLATIYESENQFYRAASCYARIVRLEPRDQTAWQREAMLLLRAGDAATALALFERAKSDGTPLPETVRQGYRTALLRNGKLADLRRELAATPPKQRHDYWRLLHELASAENRPPEKLRETILHFRTSQDPDVRFLALTTAADTAMREKNWTQARKYLDAASRLEPMLTQLRHAHLARLSGNPTEEQRFLEQRRDFAPNDLTTLAALGDHYAARNNPDAIRKLLQTFHPRTRAGLETRYYLEGTLDFLAGKPAEVVNKLRLARNLRNRQFYHTMLFDAHLRLRDYHALRDDIAGILRYTEAPQAAGSAIVRQLEMPLRELNPLRSDDYEKIKILLREMLQAAPSGSPAKRTALLQGIRLETQRNHSDRAREYAEQLYREFPDAAARLILVDCLLAAHAPQQAMLHLNAMPSGLARSIRLGRLREQQGDQSGAETAFREAVTAAPQSLLAATELATYLLRRGRNAEAIATLKKLPETPENRYTANEINAVAAERAGDLQAAAGFIRNNLALLEEQPDSPELQIKKAACLARLNRPADAEKLYDQALPHIHPDVRNLIYLSDVKAALGKHREANEYAAQARNLDPGAPEVQECLRRRNETPQPR